MGEPQEKPKSAQGFDAEDGELRYWAADEIASFVTHPGVGRVLSVRAGTREPSSLETCLREAGYHVGRLSITRESGVLPHAAATFIPDLVYVTLGEPRDLCLGALEAIAADPRTQSIPMVALVPTDASGSLIDDAYTRSGCDFFRLGATEIELLARTHLLVRLSKMNGEGRPRLHVAPRASAANDQLGVRLDLRDHATQVYSSTYFVHRLPTEISRARRYARSLTLMLVRCPSAAEREESAVKVARTIERHVRAVDLVARMEPDVFVVLLPETSSDRTVPLAERLGAELFDQGLAHGIGVAGLDETGDGDSHTNSGLLQIALRRAIVRSPLLP